MQGIPFMLNSNKLPFEDSDHGDVLQSMCSAEGHISLCNLTITVRCRIVHYALKCIRLVFTWLEFQYLNQPEDKFDDMMQAFIKLRIQEYLCCTMHYANSISAVVLIFLDSDIYI